ncbi:MAG: imidazolonepropionase [Oligoflexales bacterium]|nr:imidazolonepropionase [Oligoflexales bacterium]
MPSFLLKNIGELVSLSPLAEEQRFIHLREDDLGSIKDAWLYCEDGKVVDFGQSPPPESLLNSSSTHQIDAKQGLVLPGFVDSHTHPIFFGNRSNEFKMRLDGVSYQEIAERGGGIMATVRASREASDEQLLAETLKHFKQFLAHGVTTVEAKSGYGLSPDEEIRHLRVLKKAAVQTDQEVKITCLALHAIPKEYASASTYVSAVCEHLLPIVAQDSLADYVDAFIESGYFSAEDCKPYFKKASELGLGIRVHADEFTDASAAEAAADWKAASADHLQFVSETGLKAMSKKGVVACILPGTSLYTAIPFTSGRRLADADCAVAIASDFNPGSCNLENLPMLAILAGLHGKLKSWEVIAGITLVPALSLGLSKQKRALAKSYDADFCIHDFTSLDEWFADFGRKKPREVWLRGVKWGS